MNLCILRGASLSSPHVRGVDFITHCSHRPSLLTQQEEAVSVLWVDYDRTYTPRNYYEARRQYALFCYNRTIKGE